MKPKPKVLLTGLTAETLTATVLQVLDHLEEIDAAGFLTAQQSGKKGRTELLLRSLDGDEVMYANTGKGRGKRVGKFFVDTEAFEEASLKAIGFRAGVDFYITGEAEDDIDQYYQMLKDKGVNIVKEIEDQFWGDRTFSIQDPDGYQFTFAKPVREVSPEEMAEALKNMEMPA